MRSFYGQRCGTAVDLGPEFPGYKHDACHTENAYHATSGKSGVKASGNKGWHDAGDYGRYVVNSGLSTATLLWTYEMFTDRVKNVRLNIPESGNGLPDILNEIRVFSRICGSFLAPVADPTYGTGRFPSIGTSEIRRPFWW
jgi:endoglucanase